MKQIFTIILLLHLANAFGQKKIINNDCPCFNGIGSIEGELPVFAYEFSNHQKINVCGFWDHETHDITDTTGSFIISEFNIFNCKSGMSYVEYSAMEICRITPRKDSISIDYLQYLPVGDNWSWEQVIVANQLLTMESDSLKISQLQTCYQKREFSKKDVDDFLEKVESEKGIGIDWEMEICKLQVLAMNGNEKAQSILFNYEKVKEDKTDGAIAETWANAVAIVKWITNIDE